MNTLAHLFIFPLKQRIAILASGAGSNARSIIAHFKKSESIEIGLIVSNNKEAGVLQIGKENQIPTFILTKDHFSESSAFLDELHKANISFIVLAGFLWRVPKSLVLAYPNAIVNIHPALLPKYGGKGMYGHFVHEAVHANNEAESGITVHFVNEHYDEGNIIFQEKVALDNTDTPLTIEQKVRALELEHYAIVIENILNDRQ